jgi:hypothetical protein
VSVVTLCPSARIVVFTRNTQHNECYNGVAKTMTREEGERRGPIVDAVTELDLLIWAVGVCSMTPVGPDGGGCMVSFKADHESVAGFGKLVGDLTTEGLTWLHPLTSSVTSNSALTSASS